MSLNIVIYRAKPNPTGKDKAGNQPLASQLLGEWVDLMNTGSTGVALSSLHLAHTEFDGNCVAKEAPTIYWNGPSGVTLNAGEIVRIHTGKNKDLALMNSQDSQGAHRRSFAEKGSFVLNNRCGDKLSLWTKPGGTWQKVDGASYGPNPQEGKILQRVSDTLV